METIQGREAHESDIGAVLSDKVYPQDFKGRVISESILFLSRCFIAS